MRRRKALQSIAVGNVGGVATLSHCNTFIASVPQLQEKDEQFIGLISYKSIFTLQKHFFSNTRAPIGVFGKPT